ncbi:murein transglycosylase domain-containing protein [Sulfurimonas sp.]|jgi:membrane-bound lytic murein transglycosylase C|uniref:murein transglycosylase domain-containing protein n=1 Tax=Sulfurimonas sp. TaxID=2022749 RepID=UPI0025CFF493|nr:murein transglycosylase domain-containing protein [Sulfurimonas sp.]MCK9474016.1 murein transglycosylase domain-containing protein [Sulfurimonas sp.]MDD3505971.1 murein transglycosylase domain-containing protein [Sulfurimonas sp.]
MPAKILTSLFLSSLLLAQNATDFKNSQEKAFKAQKDQFDAYKQNIEDAFKSYQDAIEKEYADYEQEISSYWEEPLMSSKKRWVAYTKDKKTRTNIDFEKEMIIVETIASSEKEAKEKLKKALANVVTIDTKKAQESDPLEQRLAQIKKPVFVADAQVEAEPILSTVIFEKAPSKDTLITYVEQNVQDKNIQSVDSKKVNSTKVYTLNISMPPDAMLKRSQVYKEEIQTQASRQKVPASLVFAIMHSESSFNPRAKSHVPAYGLMQIVPKTAGIDSYNFLYKEKKLVSGNYLYNSKNNITMGSAYLHILYYNYLSKITNPQSRLYCTIAAYNTGAGNVAWAFTKTNSVHKATLLINDLSPDEVYNTLLRDLKYEEPKKYLKNVSQRVLSYEKVYG